MTLVADFIMAKASTGTILGYNSNSNTTILDDLREICNSIYDSENGSVIINSRKGILPILHKQKKLVELFHDI